MNDLSVDTTSTTENGAIADVINDLRDRLETARQLDEVEPGLYLYRNSKGELETHDIRRDIETGQDRPNRKTTKWDSAKFRDVPSLAGYVAKHGLAATEITAFTESDRIVAIINAGAASDGDTDPGVAGWGDHKVTLELKTTPDWDEWLDSNGSYMPQAVFAEFVEDHLPNFATPTAADMLELAQSFRASKAGKFESTQRLKTGETTLNYVEEHQAQAGRKGQLAIPDTFTIALQVYERGQVYPIDARFRYRISGGELLLGYRLTRVNDVHLAAFDGVVNEARKATGRDIWLA